MSNLDPSSSNPEAASGFVFRPQADITVAELASILQVLLDAQQSVFLQPVIADLALQCQRHFVSKREVSLQTMLYLGASKSN
jgi:superfamily II helicase